MPKEDDDETILKLESLLKNQAKPRVSDRAAATINISAALWRKLGKVYESKRSDKIEEEMIGKLRRDGLLPPPIDSVGGGADAYFNRKAEAGSSSRVKSTRPKPGDPVWDPEDKTMRIEERGDDEEGDDEG